MNQALLIGGAILGVVNAIAGGLYEVARKQPWRAADIAPGAVLMLFSKDIDQSVDRGD